jgi:hypothetical protein
MNEEQEKSDSGERIGGDGVFTKSIRAGKRTYFFDVRITKGNDYYLSITESKRKIGIDGKYVYEKHKIFLYKEDFEKFMQGLSEVISYINMHNSPKEELVPKAEETDYTQLNFEDLPS